MAKKTLCKELDFRGDYSNIFGKAMNFIFINCYTDVGECEEVKIEQNKISTEEIDYIKLEREIEKHLIKNKLFIVGVKKEANAVVIETTKNDIYDLLFVPEFDEENYKANELEEIRQEIKEEEVTDAEIINKEKYEELISLGEELIKKCSSSNDDTAVCIKKDGSIYHTTNDFSREIYYGDAIVVYTVDNTTTIENIRQQIEQTSNITKEDFVTDQERDKLIEKENYEYAQKYGKICPKCRSIVTNLAPNGAGVMEECNWHCEKCGWEE
ncbi:hypothetical protein [Clostridium botulinum]|uniref:hypothetical protein n=1 Tax=Clostridium botulinum TaxID=1491 RepID=UPI000AA468F7|nr:hypothetical protein [Clostridium botulinum]